MRQCESYASFGCVRACGESIVQQFVSGQREDALELLNADGSAATAAWLNITDCSASNDQNVRL